MYDVTFLVKATSAIVTKNFNSLYLAKKFVNKLKYSKKLALISCPIFEK